MLSNLTPNEYYDSIFDITPGYIKKIGINGLIVDLDNTLIPRNEIIAPSELVKWLDGMKEAGLKLVIVSNNSKTRGSKIAHKLDLPLVATAKKPWRTAFNKGLKSIGSKKDESAVIGDQIFTDVLGGNRMGLYTILVVPLSGKEFIGTRVVRQIEKVVLKRLEKRKLIPKDERRNGNNGQD